jgi:hypothetical protein
MSFRSEEISDADHEKYKCASLAAYRFGGRDSDCVRFANWTIDRERNSFLVFLGGGIGPFPERFALVWNGEIVVLECSSRRRRDEGIPTAVAVDYRVLGIYLTPALMNRREELLALVREALDAYGNIGDRTNVETVTVTIEPNCWHTPNPGPELSWSREQLDFADNPNEPKQDRNAADLRPIPENVINLPLPPKVQHALNEGRWVEAIRLLHQVHGMGLVEAKHLLENHSRHH